MESGPVQATLTLCLQRQKTRGPTLFKINKNKIFIVSDGAQSDTPQSGDTKPHCRPFCRNGLLALASSFPEITIPTCTSYVHGGITCSPPAAEPLSMLSGYPKLPVHHTCHNYDRMACVIIYSVFPPQCKVHKDGLCLSYSLAHPHC